MRAPNRIFPGFVLLLFATVACGVPISVAPPDPNAVSTVVQQTVNAILTQSAMPVFPSATLSISQTPTSTFTPQPPTLTPTSTSTPLPIFTPTPMVPSISVSVATNCRSGPGRIYAYRGALLVGETTEILARDPTGNYWYVRNPDSAGNFCWLWGRYATVTGNFGVLPVYTPPPTPSPTFTPTPAPSFTASFTSLDTCNANWWVEVRIKNTGSITFESVSITVKDKVTDVTLVDLSDGFTDRDGCLNITTKDVIAPGDTYILSGPPFSYNPTGNEIRVTLTLCSVTGQNGTCVTDKFTFTP